MKGVYHPSISLMPYDVIMHTTEPVIPADYSWFHDPFRRSPSLFPLFIWEKQGLKVNFEGLLSVAEVIVGQTLLLTDLLVHNGQLLEARGFVTLVETTRTT
jgi:hypothetical protein